MLCCVVLLSNEVQCSVSSRYGVMLYVIIWGDVRCVVVWGGVGWCGV